MRRPFRLAFRLPGRPRDVARDVDDEIAFHLASRVDDLVARGLTPEAARAEALRQFGATAPVRASCVTLDRERIAAMHRASAFENLARGLAHAVRALRAQRGFAAVVALTMMLGIGANVAMFSVAYSVLLRPLPFRDADALVRLWSKNVARGIEFFSVSPADYLTWRAENRTFAAIGAFERQRDATLLRGGEPQLVSAARVEPAVFALLGAGASLGRPIAESDAAPGAAAVAVLAHDLWTTRLGGDSAVLGTSVVLDGRQVTVVGVMPPRFSLPGSTATVWLPLSLASATTERGDRYLRVLARLRPRATVAAAGRDLDAIAARVARENAGTNRDWTVNVVSLPEWIVGREWRRAVLALGGVVAFVLLIACANAANLQLARGAGRAREIALRAALGADRLRIVAQLLAESLLLAALGGAAGLALAWAAVRALRAAGADALPRLDEVGLDPTVLAFSFGVIAVSGVLFGLLPALRASRADLGAVLRAGGRGATGAVGRRTRAALVVGQVALSLVLLVGAGLMLRSVRRLQAVELGFAPGDVQLATVTLPTERYPDAASRAAFWTRLVDQARRAPGVRGAALASSAPFDGPNTGLTFLLPERPPAPGDPPPDADTRDVTAGYFRTLGISLVRGRDFAERPPAASPQEAPQEVIVSETAARQYWPGVDPVGRQITLTDDRRSRFTVVGVVHDVRYGQIDGGEVRPMLYFDAGAFPRAGLTLVVRQRDGFPVAFRAALRALDPTLPVPTVASMETLVARATATQRFSLALFALFAVTALALSAIGIYGMLAYLVRQRIRELGVRAALGASRTALAREVVADALRVTLPGVALGLVGAWALTRLIASLLFGVSPTDVATFAGVSAVLVATAVIASVVPARRAGAADPMTVLREDG